ncbi:MAG: diaminopimelate epimerase [Firmicutes bacterium]|nr:diaminopimelate epimerase [Bacillota bacterium]
MRFTKMQGLGNDYIYVDALEQEVPSPALLSRGISDRHFGIGGDGLILLLPATRPDADFRMRIFNADGSEAKMCGNGIRCLARYIYTRGLLQRPELHIETLAGVRTVWLTLEGGKVTGARVDMGEPVLEPQRIPMAASGPEFVRQPLPFEIQGNRLEVLATAVSMGNPHCVLEVEDTAKAPVETWGPAIEHHPAFPERVNVEFVQVLESGHLKVRVWERGSGETLACGTGACASLVAAHRWGKTGRRAQVSLPGGSLEIEWGPDGHVYMTGPAVEVFEGDFDPWQFLPAES